MALQPQVSPDGVIPGGRLRTVPVEGGVLTVHEASSAGETTPVVVALHGITANAATWRGVVRELGGAARVLAPDLRGRADSADVAGPWGLDMHVADVVTALDHAEVDSALLVGHSMGAFVAASAAVRHPDRVRGVLLVDGGVALTIPEGIDLETAMNATLGPAVRRLEMRFEDEADYLDYWREHPALADGFDATWAGDLTAYLRHDLRPGEQGGWRSSCVLDAVRADSADVLRAPRSDGPVHRLTVPTTLLWAERGMMDEEQGLYDEARLAEAGLGSVTTRQVPGTNHYTILLSPDGISATTGEIRRMLRD